MHLKLGHSPVLERSDWCRNLLPSVNWFMVLFGLLGYSTGYDTYLVRRREVSVISIWVCNTFADARSVFLINLHILCVYVCIHVHTLSEDL